ncbi:MAG: hypothetical protein Q8M44_00905 [bacterium]|nr:hypothetical protein [bacterium]
MYFSFTPTPCGYTPRVLPSGRPPWKGQKIINYNFSPIIKGIPELRGEEGI